MLPEAKARNKQVDFLESRRALGTGGMAGCVCQTNCVGRRRVTKRCAVGDLNFRVWG
jgi:hypothetical protein